MASTNANPAVDPWDAAWQRCRTKLSPQDLTSIQSVSSYDDLSTAISNLRDKYQRKSAARAMERLQPFLANLKSFTGAIDTMVQSNPAISALIWGGLKFLIELASRVTGALEKVAVGLEQIGHALPRLEEYKLLFPNAPRVASGLAMLYESIVSFCIYAIKYLKSHPLKNFFKAFWSDFHSKLEETLGQIRQQVALIDKESYAAKMTDDMSHFADIKALLHTRTHRTQTVNLPYYYLSYSQNPGFFGQTNALQTCLHLFQNQAQFTSLVCFALHGIGGVGKTSIALQCVYSLKSQFRVILWFFADSIAKLTQGYVEVANAIFGERSPKPEQDREKVKTWLCQTEEKWLIVFDNLDDLDTVRDFWPHGGSGAIIITSRNPESEYTLAKRGHKVEPFTESDGSDFLLSMLPGMDGHDPEIAARSLEVCRRLGGLALALKQMAAFVRESGCTLEDLNRFLLDKTLKLQLFGDGTGFPQVDYAQTIATAWELSLIRLSQDQSNLLACLAFFDPDVIPQTITDCLCASVEAARSLFPTIENKISFLQCIRVLIRFGLVEKNESPQSLRLHRLVRDITLQRLSEGTRQELFNIAINAIWNGHPKTRAASDTSIKQWHICVDFPAHISSLLMSRTEWSLQARPPEVVFEMLYESAWYLMERGNMSMALEYIQASEPYCDLSTKQGRIDMSYAYSLRGLIDLQHENLEISMSWYEKSLVMRRENLTPSSPLIPNVMQNMAMTLRAMGRYEEALEQIDKAAEYIRDEGITLERTVRSVHGQKGTILLALNRLEEAEIETEKAAAFLRKDPEFPMKRQVGGLLVEALYYFILGNIRLRQGKLDEGFHLHSLALKVRSEVLGDHIQTGASLHKVGDLLAQKGNLELAKITLLDARRVYGSLKLLDGFGQGGQARACFLLSRICFQMRQEDQGRSYLEEATQLRQKLVAAGDPDSVQEPLTQELFDALVNDQDL